MNEKINELFDLIKANPDLPILPMVDYEIIGEDYGRWAGSWGTAYVGEYIMGNSRIWFRDDDDDERERVLEDCVGGVDFWREPGGVVKRVYNELPWIKAIIVNIDLPEG
ncbi:hypothetical protein [Cuneatibacter caecimuris]|uniref:Uncharacterized protein n=1 Tax=Cuneatibacter caecimuris TaxID=1796618 RepID=A0A4Q7PK87_9FIRM|nr:hypothetical protein [Cuneatibacter caecimuris]RZT00915.1 hypothetical protein EV209_1351 [Cuneatibacter caecimuris]